MLELRFDDDAGFATYNVAQDLAPSNEYNIITWPDGNDSSIPPRIGDPGGAMVPGPGNSILLESESCDDNPECHPVSPQ